MDQALAEIWTLLRVAYVCFNANCFPFDEGKEITQRSILIGIPVWLICGLCYGLTMSRWMNKKGRQHT